MHERGARRQKTILEHASPVLASALGKIGQGVNRGWWRPGEIGGAPGAGREALILLGGAGRGAWDAGQRPPAPLPTLRVSW